MTNGLLIAWLATMGADRVDLLAGGGPFLLTPFLALTPFMVAVQLARAIGRGDSTIVPSGAARYALIITAFLGVALLSLFLAVDVEAGARRFALLVFQVYATLLGAIFLCNAPDRRKVLVAAAYAGLGIALAFDLIQGWLWVNGQTAEAGSEGKVFFLTAWSYGPWVPRLSGPAIDMNRGGLLFLVYLFLLIRFARPSGWRRIFIAVAVLGILVTLSRSAIMALTVMAGLLLLQKGRGLKIPRPALVGSAMAVGTVALAVVLMPESFQAAAEVVGPPLLLRVMGDASSSIHFALFGHGIEMGAASMKNALLGVGFGNSFAVLEEFFPGDKYGNFHSLYLTYWVETGIVGLFLGVVLLVYPFLKSSVYRPLLGAIIVFNVFYQSSMEPIFWFVCAAAWLGVGERITRRPDLHPSASVDTGGSSGRSSPLLSRAAGTLILIIGLSGCSDLLPPSYEYSTITVTANRLNGDPVEGVDVTLYTWDRDLMYGETDSAGRYVFRFVPFGDYGVAVGPPEGYRFPGPSAQFDYADGLTTTAGSDTAVSFLLLKEGPGAVHVQVTDRAGEPIQGAGLELYTFSGAVAVASSDSDGAHTFTEVPAGEYGVFVFAPAEYLPRSSFQAGLRVEADYEERVTFQLERCQGTVLVSVRDDAGGPVAQLPVTLYTWNAVISEGMTDAQGTHRFSLDCGGEYGVRIDLPAGIYIAEGGKNYVDGLSVTPDAEIEVGFVVATCLGELEVRVVDGTGAAVEGAGLRLFTHAETVDQATTGAAGTLVFTSLACGQYGVELTPPAGYRTASGEPSSIIAGLDVTDGGRTAVEFVLDRV